MSLVVFAPWSSPLKVDSRPSDPRTMPPETVCTIGRFCGKIGRRCDTPGLGLECTPSFGPADMRHMLQGAREGASDAGQSVSRRADRPPAAGAGVERANGRELHPAEWDLA